MLANTQLRAVLGYGGQWACRQVRHMWPESEASRTGSTAASKNVSFSSYQPLLQKQSPTCLKILHITRCFICFIWSKIHLTTGRSTQPVYCPNERGLGLGAGSSDWAVQSIPVRSQAALSPPEVRDMSRIREVRGWHIFRRLLEKCATIAWTENFSKT